MTPLPQPLVALLAVLAGAALGGLYFGGLWWTVSRLPERDHPYRLLALSFGLRTAVVLAGFWALVRLGGWGPPVLGLGGFLLARLLLVRRFGLED